MKKRVLIIDDEVFFRTILSKLVSVAGYNYHIADSGEKGYELVLKNHYDCIFVDYQMYELNGIEFVKLIRSNPDPAIAEVPIVLLTGCVQKEIVDAAYEAGISLFRQKLELKQTAECIDSIMNEAISNNELHLVNNSLMFLFKGFWD